MIYSVGSLTMGDSGSHQCAECGDTVVTQKGQMGVRLVLHLVPEDRRDEFMVEMFALALKVAGITTIEALHAPRRCGGRFRVHKYLL